MASAALWLYRAIMGVSLPLAAPWLVLSDRRRGKHRPPLARRLGHGLPPFPQDCVWVQAVSVGEVAVARPLMTELRRRRPELPLLLSATTATGLALASGQKVAEQIVPFPVDLPGPVRRFLDAAHPRLVVLVETELWPEMLAGCAARRIPVALVNARISDRSFRGYRALRGLLRPLLEPLTLVLAQDVRDADRIRSLGVPAGRIHVTGNVKFDAPPPADHPELRRRLEALAAERPVFVAGSTMAGEEVPVLDALDALDPASRPFLLLAPRHPERSGEVLQLLRARSIPAVLRSAIETAPDPCDAVVLDTVGELAALYRLGAAAFIGGSLVPTGGHNPIEPARFGVPVLTGPHVHNFAAVYRSFTASGAAVVVRDAPHLATALGRWLEDPPAARDAGAAGLELIQRGAGATARTVDHLERLL